MFFFCALCVRTSLSTTVPSSRKVLKISMKTRISATRKCNRKRDGRQQRSSHTTKQQSANVRTSWEGKMAAYWLSSFQEGEKRYARSLKNARERKICTLWRFLTTKTNLHRETGRHLPRALPASARKNIR